MKKITIIMSAPKVVRRFFSLIGILICVFALAVNSQIAADTGEAIGYQKISNGTGGLPENLLALHNNFGRAVASIGDIDGDGVDDVAVGAVGEHDIIHGDMYIGAVYILFLNEDGTCKYYQEISNGVGGLPLETVGESDYFGSSIASIGDLDRDGINEIAVGSVLYGGVGESVGAIFVLWLNSDGTVRECQIITNGEGGLPSGTLENYDYFGNSVASLGDIDGDGIPDIAVGAYKDNGGSVYLLYLNEDGSCKDYQKITQGGEGGFPYGIFGGDFGSSVASLGDLDRDGVRDIVIGAQTEGGLSRGTVYIIFLNEDESYKDHQEIFDGLGLHDYDYFGCSTDNLGDLDGDGVVDIAVGAYGVNYGSLLDVGAVYILFLNSDGTVKSYSKIGNGIGGFPSGLLDGSDYFGFSVAKIGDLDGDGKTDIIAGADHDDDGQTNAGAVYMLFLDGIITPPTTPVVTDEGRWTTNYNQLFASWTSEDPETPIVEYQYKITENNPEGSIIRDWTSTGTDNYVTAGGLNLIVGKTYYFGVKAKNEEGMWSEVGYSDGISVIGVIPITPRVDFPTRTVPKNP